MPKKGIDNISKIVDLLFELVGDPNFSKKSIDKERPIIDQELAMYRDEPTWPISDSIMKQLFGDSNLGLDIGGTSQTIKKINSRNLAKIYQENYTANNMHFIAVGDFAPSAVTRLFGQIKKLDKQYLQSGQKREHTFKPEMGNLGLKEFKNKTEVPYFCLGVKLPDFKKVLVNNDLGQILVEIMLESLLGENSSWYQDKMVHGELTSPLQFGVNYTRQGNFATILGINNGNSLLNNVKETLFSSEKTAEQMDELKDLFEMQKKVSMATLLSAFNNLSELGFELAEEAINGENIFDTIKLLQQMNFEKYWQICQDLLAESETCSVFSTVE
ncbi:M16 family metallopeptidase [Lactobacillus jensenii]|uniref:M16 family metallopeptidase n=1 Tax=Lactobacillus jensenii TaxID=109790 RepID=UPI0035BE149E